MPSFHNIKYLKAELPSQADMVIVGGGVIGVSIACYLPRMSASHVLVLDKGRVGEGSTFRQKTFTNNRLDICLIITENKHAPNRESKNHESSAHGGF